MVWTHTKVLPVSLPEEVLGPHNAVNGFTGCVAYGTAWKRLGSWLWLALITLTVTLQRVRVRVRLGGHLIEDQLTRETWWWLPCV